LFDRLVEMMINFDEIKYEIRMLLIEFELEIRGIEINSLLE